MTPAHVQEARGGLGDVPGHGMHSLLPVAADGSGVPVMIGENGLHHLRGDLTPAAFNQVPQALQPRAGIGRGVSFVRGDRVAC